MGLLTRFDGEVEALMRRTIVLSVDNVRDGRGGPFASLVAKDGRVIATGVNAVTATNDPTAHAEMNAIRAACQELGSFRLTGCELYTSCEPCPMCLGAIYWARPDRIFFATSRADASAAGFDDEVIYAEIALPVESRSIPMRQILHEEAQAAFQLWNRSGVKILY